METKRFLRSLIQHEPVRSSSFQKYISAHYIGFNKSGWPGNRTIDVAFSGQMHHSIRLMLCEDTIHCIFVANIRMFKGISVAIADFTKRLKVTGISRSITLTTSSWVFLIICRTTAEPIKPAPPVTKNFHVICSVWWKCLDTDALKSGINSSFRN